MPVLRLSMRVGIFSVTQLPDPQRSARWPGPSKRPTSTKCQGPVTPFGLQWLWASRPMQSGHVAINAMALPRSLMDGCRPDGPTIPLRPRSSCGASRINVTMARRAAGRRRAAIRPTRSWPALPHPKTWPHEIAGVKMEHYVDEVGVLDQYDALPRGVDSSGKDA